MRKRDILIIQQTKHKFGWRRKFFLEKFMNCGKTCERAGKTDYIIHSSKYTTWHQILVHPCNSILYHHMYNIYIYIYIYIYILPPNKYSWQFFRELFVDNHILSIRNGTRHMHMMKFYMFLNMHNLSTYPRKSNGMLRS